MEGIMTETNNVATFPHCGVCRRAGAQWVVKSGSRQMPVHKPCGKRLAEQAPKDAIVKIVPSDMLRAEWDARDAREAAQSFWTEKFQDAERKRDAKAVKHNGTDNAAPPAQPSSG